MPSLLDLVPSSYGYVVLVAAGGSMINIYLQTKVMAARKSHGVKVSE